MADDEETIMLDRQSTRLAEAIEKAGKHRVDEAPEAPRFKPLGLQDFEAVTARQVDLGNRFARALPAPRGPSAPSETACELLESLTGISGYEIFVHAMRVHPATFRAPDLGSFFTTRFELPPGSEVGLIAAELSLLQGVLGAMVGEPDDMTRRVAPVGPRDFGLGTYVLLRLLDALVSEHGMAPFVLGGAPPDEAERRAILEGRLEIAEVVFLVSAPSHAGFVRCFFPAHMVHEIELFAHGQFASARRRRAIMESALAGAEVEVALGIASLELSPIELAELTIGDVLLPTEHALDFEGIQPAETGARLYIDAAGHGFIAASAITEPRRGWRVVIDDTQCHRVEENMAGEQTKDQHAAASEATSNLVDHATIAVEVRVGNASLTVSEVAAMQSGQILDLGVPLGEPVSIVAGGATIGKGELVNIEGRLGVRMLARY